MKLNNFDDVGNLTQAQQFMIRSCLATSGEEREHTVRAWEETVVIDDLDFSSSRLVPVFFHGNQGYGITTRHDNRLKIIYKHWWLRTQHISHQLKIVTNAFFDAGIEVVVIKGASIKTYYERDELRPMADFDLLLQPFNLQKALQVIKALDYLPAQQAEAYLGKHPKLFLDFNHAINCVHQRTDSQLDLHWRVGSGCSAKFSDDLWLHLDNYSPVPYAKRPQPAYELFMLVIHAADSENRDNLNWIIDTAMINQKAGKPFWLEARKLAVAEKKEDLFDYGCAVLVKLGIEAPDPGMVSKPRGIISTTIEDRKHFTSIKLFRTRIGNIIYGIKRLFPHSGPLSKLFYIVKNIYYQCSRKVGGTIKQ